MRELDTIRAERGGCATGQAVITSAGKLDARYIIHAVGPVFHGGKAGESELLRSCYRESFRLAAEHECRSIALSAISTGVYGYPIEAAAEISLDEARRFLSQPSSVEEATFVLFSQASLDAFARFL